METTLTRDCVIRNAHVDDAEQLAGFFRLAYGNSSHECQDAEHVRMTIERGTTSWFVAVREERVMACTANIPHPWNRSIETCRIFARPDANGLNLGRRLYRTALDAVHREPECDMHWGSPRSHGVSVMVRRGLETPGILVGHDGGMHVANGEREYHLMIVTRNPNRPIPRVIPPGSAVALAPFIREQIVSHLSFTTTTGDYPSLYVVGPSSERSAAVGECVFFYDYDPTSPSQSLQITNVAASRADTKCVTDALARFLAGFPPVRHVSAYVLVDKEALIRRMRTLGFSVASDPRPAECRYGRVIPGGGANEHLCGPLARAGDPPSGESRGDPGVFANRQPVADAPLSREHREELGLWIPGPGAGRLRAHGAAPAEPYPRLL